MHSSHKVVVSLVGLVTADPMLEIKCNKIHNSLFKQQRQLQQFYLEINGGLTIIALVLD